MTIKVIGAGFGRTGTTSLQAALEELGFGPCYHMSDLIKHSTHPHFWEDVGRDQEADWDQIFQNYQATVDWPGCTFYQELMTVYPEAKVILSVRDPDRWYDSMLTTVYRWPNSLFVNLLKLFLPHLRTMYRMVDTQVWQGTFGGQFENRAEAIAIFNRHNAEVKAAVPPQRLLVYSVQEGWEPLCRFLEVDVPQDRPFPHLNDALLMQRAMRWGPMVLLGAAGGIVALLVWLIWGLI